MSIENEENQNLGREPSGAGENDNASRPNRTAADGAAGGGATDRANFMRAIHDEISKLLIGRKDTLDLMMAALLTEGHVLLEGMPGIAKTLTAKLLAKSMNVGFSRIQFTPDLMPSDIIGSTVFDMKRSEFHFKKGPIFNHVILIDEINRAPAKTQAALMEVMEERQVTVDGVTYPLPPPFFVIATQNPVEHEGTYKLPEAQLDRFMFKLNMDYPDAEEEKLILHRFQSDFFGRSEADVRPVVTAEEILKQQEQVEKVHITEELIGYIANLVSHTRHNSDLYLGASPRASLNILKGAKAMAVMSGREYVTPDDIKKVAHPVLSHRLILSYERELEGVEITDVIESLVNKTEVPR